MRWALSHVYGSVSVVLLNRTCTRITGSKVEPYQLHFFFKSISSNLKSPGPVFCSVCGIDFGLYGK
jgi:hypothetical protein